MVCIDWYFKAHPLNVTMLMNLFSLCKFFLLVAHADADSLIAASCISTSNSMFAITYIIESWVEF